MADEKPGIDFSTFMISLGSSALVHLGQAPDPTSGEKTAPDLMMAQQSIDLLALLQEKTRGNLTAEEAKFLESLLYDLRMRYLTVAQKK